jgi:predicted RecB family nuclease
MFSAYVKCPTKAHFLASGEAAPGTFFRDAEARISSVYIEIGKRRAQGKIIEAVDFSQLSSRTDYGENSHYVNCETATIDVAQLAKGMTRRKPQTSSLAGQFVPILHFPWENAGVLERMLVCFGALALSQAVGILPKKGALICGDGYKYRPVNISSLVGRTSEIVDKIAEIGTGQNPPPLTLNKHCAVCDFQMKCRNIAIDRDDLSLLTAMPAKERTKCHCKGVSTITQLSYGYRPRRRKRVKHNSENAGKTSRTSSTVLKHDHKLRALAIKKGQIHVVGTPTLGIKGVPIFLDVEGMPDRNCYYLIGLRFECGGSTMERSFWADETKGEKDIWKDCLLTLKEISNPQIVSYGAYETRFLRQMRERYASVDEIEFIDRLIENSINLIACIYGKIYFPTYSNGLKDLGQYLGHKWTWENASGAAAPLLRRAWELDPDERLKHELVGYNMEDCRAASRVADELMRICSGCELSQSAVNVASLEVDFEQSWGKFNSVVPGFEKINGAAYWDYQRDRIYVRSSSSIRRAAKRKRAKAQFSPRVNTTVQATRPSNCPACKSTQISMNGRWRRTVIDMKFSDGCLRRWVTKYGVDCYKCSECGITFNSDRRDLGRSPYGTNVMAYVIYNLIEVHISQYQLSKIIQKMFGFCLSQQSIHRMAKKSAEKYLTTYDEIKQRLLNGRLIHADETHVSIKGRKTYVWVYTSMEDVIYTWSESREGHNVGSLLKDFQGVLISDFYAAYDSIPCPQQRCLIHLIRDLNSDVHKEPFNLEIKEIAQAFGAVLRPIIETVDRFGLKAHFLRKHNLAVGRFYDILLKKKYDTSLAQKTRVRLQRNKTRLFTFLNYDNVPWNNNNAEHAIKSFSALRSVIEGTINENGIRNYLTLLSVQQTCVYRDIDFFGFLRSDETEIAGYAGKRGP